MRRVSAVLADALEHVEAAEAGEVEVEDDDGGHDREVAPREGAGAEKVVHRLLAVAGHDDLVHDVVAAQRPERKALIVLIVLDQENELAIVSRVNHRSGHLTFRQRGAVPIIVEAWPSTSNTTPVPVTGSRPGAKVPVSDAGIRRKRLVRLPKRS